MAQLDITINETKILSTVWMNPGISRIGLARELCLHKSTITKIVSSLIEEGLLVLSDTPDILMTKGRRPTGLYINDLMGVVIGVEVRTDSWNGVILELSGKIIETVAEKSDNESDTLTSLLMKPIDDMVERVVKSGRRVLGVGLGLAGQIDPYKGIILSSNPLNVRSSLDFRKDVGEAYPFPVFIENDANCCCWNVFLEKRCDRERNFLCILGEYRKTGMFKTQEYMNEEGIAIGMGLVIRDNVLHGDKFTAGEFQSVFKKIPNATQFNVKPEKIRFLQSDKDLRIEVIKELARNTALLINVMGLSMIKIFGNFINEPEVMSKIFYDEIQKNWLNSDTNQVDCRIEVSDQDKNAVAIGAAAYYMYRVFSSPELWRDRDMSDPSGIELLRK